MPKNWEGPVKLRETKKGSNVFTIEAHKNGKYSAEDVPAMLKALISAKAKLDGWKVWVDEDSGFSVELARGQVVTHAMLAKLTKEADNVQLAYVKRPWPQPKLYFTKGNATPRKTTKTSDLREL